MRWAFWRRRTRDSDSRPDDRAVDQPAPAPDSGAPTRPVPPGDSRDEDDSPARPAGGPFSGASPDAGGHPAPESWRSAVPDASAEPVDEAELASSGATVAAVVRAVLAGDPAAVRAAVLDASSVRAAAAAASGVLAARLPALSGVDGPLSLDEDEGDLLHAYVDLLAARAEPRRAQVAPAVTREQLVVVAHLSAAAAIGDAASEPSLLVLPGIPAPEQLLAACVLLAQTCADGGGDVDELPEEVARLFG